MQLRFLPAGRK